MNVTSSVRKSPIERSDSDLRVDLHVYVVPSDLWQKHLHSVVNQVISDTVSAGFIRVLPETLIADVREELEIQIDDEILPKNYIFLRCVGRCFTRLRPRQERTLKVKHFIPPKTYAPELFILESSADEAHGISSTGSSSVASSNRYSESTSNLRTPETGVFSMHKRIPPIVDNTRSTQTGNDGWSSSNREFRGARISYLQQPEYENLSRTDPSSTSNRSQERMNKMPANVPQLVRAMVPLDDVEANNKASQTNFDPVDTSEGTESLPMLIELYEDSNNGDPTGPGDDEVDFLPLSATPNESNTYRRNGRVDDEERIKLEELMRKQEENELRLREKKRKLEDEQKAWETQKQQQLKESEERTRLLAEQQRQADELKKLLDERRREEEQRKKDEAERTDALRRQAMEEQRKIDHEWEEFNDSKNLEEQRKKEEHVTQLKEQSVSEKDRRRLEEQRKKEEELKRQQQEQQQRSQKIANEKAALLKEIDEFRSNRLKAEQDRNDLMNRARQLQGKARNTRTVGRDAWKKKYFEEKRKTVPLEEQSHRLRAELDVLNKKILSQMDYNGRREATSRAITSYSVGSAEPSPQNNLKILAVKHQQEIESIQRRIGDVNMKLTAEMKLRNQVEVELRKMKAQLAHRRSDLLTNRGASGPNSTRAMNAPPAHWAQAKQTELA